MSKPNFSFDDFKKWMETHDEEIGSTKMERKKDYIGYEVEPKIDTKKLSAKIQVESGNDDEIIRDFQEGGGTVIDVDGRNFLIEVDSGTFFIARHYVRKL